MEYKRILTIQDISCVGQCSMTVAMPVLSACGHETCILPTAMLSTHTGGFGKPEIVHFDHSLNGIWQHWKENNIAFDAILVGYLGSIPAIHTAIDVIDQLLAPGGAAIVDPAMADHGRLYSGFDMAYVQEMKKLCQRADIILPNITEAALLSGMVYKEIMEENYVNSILDGLNHDSVILTGVGYSAGQTGAVIYRKGSCTYIPRDRISGSFHGTGDIFAACFTGAMVSGKNMEKSVEIAAKFTEMSIKNTIEAPAHWYGIKFEPLLSALHDMIWE